MVFSYFLQIIEGKKTGLFPKLLCSLLLPISLIYQSISVCRNKAFDLQWIPSKKPDAPLIISVGNITAGGTGKTPTTLFLAKTFSAFGQVAILSRGYRSQAEKLKTPTFLSQGKGPLHSAAFAGDEPYLLAQAVPRAYVIVGRNRCQAASMAVQAGADILILDDGLQHRYLQRDFDIITIDGRHPFSNGFYLPRGLLRESPNALQRAALIIVNHLEKEEEFTQIVQQLRAYTQAPIVGGELRLAHIVSANGAPLNSLQNQKIAVFCGIANPERLIRTVEKLGAEVVDKLFLTDHAGISAEKLQAFALKSLTKGANWVICTEKDAVKLPNITSSLPIAWLQMEMAIKWNQAEWENFLSVTKFKGFR